MLEVWLVVEAEVNAIDKAVVSSPTTSAMVEALKEAMATYPVRSAVARVVSSGDLDNLYSSYLYGGNLVESRDETEIILCPLTLNLPTTFSFPHQEIYQACRDVVGLRHLVDRQLGYAIGDGCFWLPVVLTGKGPLYGEAIGLREQTTDGSLGDRDSTLCLSYSQPIHLCDAKRQRIYKLAHRLLQLLAAPPATYLVQFGFQGEDICFDRLWPFPAAPALASQGVQSPDLFACHWHCLTDRPLFDLAIVPSGTTDY